MVACGTKKSKVLDSRYSIGTFAGRSPGKRVKPPARAFSGQHTPLDGCSTVAAATRKVRKANE